MVYIVTTNYRDSPYLHNLFTLKGLQVYDWTANHHNPSILNVHGNPLQGVLSITDFINRVHTQPPIFSVEPVHAARQFGLFHQLVTFPEEDLQIDSYWLSLRYPFLGGLIPCAADLWAAPLSTIGTYKEAVQRWINLNRIGGLDD